MQNRFLINALYFNKKHRRAFKKYLIRLIAFLRDPDNGKKRLKANVALQRLYDASLDYLPGRTAPSEATNGRCLERLRDRHKAEWSRLLCNALLAETDSAGLYDKLKKLSPHADKTVFFVESRPGYEYIRGDNDKLDHKIRELAAHLRKTRIGTIERFCVLIPASGEGEPEVIPLERQDDDP